MVGGDAQYLPDSYVVVKTLFRALLDPKASPSTTRLALGCFAAAERFPPVEWGPVFDGILNAASPPVKYAAVRLAVALQQSSPALVPKGTPPIRSRDRDIKSHQLF